MTNQLDLARLEYWKDKFDLLVEVKEWEVVISCAKCGMEIPKDHNCILPPKTYRRQDISRQIIQGRSCPHCLVHAYGFDDHHYWNSDSYWVLLKPIDIKLSRRRFIVTKRIKKWFKTIEEGFWEYQEIESWS